MCSESAVRSRKNIASASPTSVYCTGWMASRLSSSNTRNAAKVRPMKRKPYLEARDLPARREAVGADVVRGRQEAALERRMRPVGAQRDGGVGAERRDRERLGAGELEVDRELDLAGLRQVVGAQQALQAAAGVR